MRVGRYRTTHTKFCTNDVILTSLVQYDKTYDVIASIYRISKFGQQQLVMVNLYEYGFNQSETDKYFE